MLKVVDKRDGNNSLLQCAIKNNYAPEVPHLAPLPWALFIVLLYNEYEPARGTFALCADCYDPNWRSSDNITTLHNFLTEEK